MMKASMNPSYRHLLASLALAGSLATGSPLEDLASPDQGIRDKAAAELRASFQSTPESKWQPVIDGIKAGQTKGEILELLKPFKVTPEMGVGSGQSHSEGYRLDDEWILMCAFRNEGDILTGRSLIRSIRQVAPAAPKDFTGKWVLYFVNGNKSHEIPMKDGKYFGEFIAYHPNGAKACVQHYTEEGASGDDTGYHPSGKVSYRGQHKAGKQTGKWTWYDEDGQITSTRDYNDP
jgi:hypothetical protein